MAAPLEAWGERADAAEGARGASLLRSPVNTVDRTLNVADHDRCGLELPAAVDVRHRAPPRSATIEAHALRSAETARTASSSRRGKRQSRRKRKRKRKRGARLERERRRAPAVDVDRAGGSAGRASRISRRGYPGGDGAAFSGGGDATPGRVRRVDRARRRDFRRERRVEPRCASVEREARGSLGGFFGASARGAARQSGRARAGAPRASRAIGGPWPRRPVSAERAARRPERSPRNGPRPSVERARGGGRPAGAACPPRRAARAHTLDRRADPRRRRRASPDRGGAARCPPPGASRRASQLAADTSAGAAATVQDGDRRERRRRRHASSQRAQKNETGGVRRRRLARRRLRRRAQLRRPAPTIGARARRTAPPSRARVRGVRKRQPRRGGVASSNGEPPFVDARPAMGRRATWSSRERLARLRSGAGPRSPRRRRAAAAEVRADSADAGPPARATGAIGRRWRTPRRAARLTHRRRGDRGPRRTGERPRRGVAYARRAASRASRISAAIGAATGTTCGACRSPPTVARHGVFSRVPRLPRERAGRGRLRAQRSRRTTHRHIHRTRASSPATLGEALLEAMAFAQTARREVCFVAVFGRTRRGAPPSPRRPNPWPRWRASRPKPRRRAPIGKCGSRRGGSATRGRARARRARGGRRRPADACSPGHARSMAAESPATAAAHVGGGAGGDAEVHVGPSRSWTRSGSRWLPPRCTQAAGAGSSRAKSRCGGGGSRRRRSRPGPSPRRRLGGPGFDMGGAQLQELGTFVHQLATSQQHIQAQLAAAAPARTSPRSSTRWSYR